MAAEAGPRVWPPGNKEVLPLLPRAGGHQMFGLGYAGGFPPPS